MLYLVYFKRPGYSIYFTFHLVSYKIFFVWIILIFIFIFILLFSIWFILIFSLSGMYIFWLIYLILK